MKLVLHPNSLTIPSEELPGFFGSHIIAKEFRAEVKPMVNRHKCVLWGRGEATLWLFSKYGGKRTEPATPQ
jgi:hypothetical protein